MTKEERFKNWWPLLVMIIPGILFFLLFRYIPLLGSVVAFKDYSVFRGVWSSPWVGFRNFEVLFRSTDFMRILSNTLILAFFNLLFTFPMAIILALMLNELRVGAFKKGIQTILTIPHFFSWVIIAGLTFSFFSRTGLFNIVRSWAGLDYYLVMQEEKHFRVVYVLTALWRDAGWNTIVYLAAMSAIDPQLYESAMVDGASRFRQIISITLPLILPTIIIMFLLRIGNFLVLGFDHVYNLLTPMTYSVGDIIDTFVFRVGLQNARYSYATALGMFQSVVGFILVMGCNALSRKITEEGLW